ncbi:MAG TPA: mannosyl-3-phosphoglycerate synthase [Dictyobacter sp.]|nr:mannosyl-3-phosphoglycerate synthase [Dictyobacter sp.]
MIIDTVRFSHILEANGLYDLNQFLTRTAFIISHKNESLETLVSVIWYLPVESPVLILTNCSESERDELRQNLAERLVRHQHVYFIHQKDETIARFFAEHGVYTILGSDGKVLNGKGEGMYIGALIASLLNYPEWIVFFDADNFVPSALLEYTFAMGRLFLQERVSTALDASEVQHLHNVRICWSSKPTLGGPIVPGVLGRCTRVVSPLVAGLVEEWFGLYDSNMISSNAGEQGFSMVTAQELHFSSGYSVETFQLLDLLSRAHHSDLIAQPERVLLQQYQAQSPHFHEKGDEEHINRMIADSLGCFEHFKDELPASVKALVEQTYEQLQLDFRLPIVYPTIRELLRDQHILFADAYKISGQKDTIFAQQEAV